MADCLLKKSVLGNVNNIGILFDNVNSTVEHTYNETDEVNMDILFYYIILCCAIFFY